MVSRFAASLQSLRLKPLARATQSASETDIETVIKVIEVVPDAVVVVASDDRVLAANQPAKTLLPGMRSDVPLAHHLRSPDVLDAIAKARADRTTVRTSWLERVPVERLYEVTVTPVFGLGCGPVVAIYLHDISETRRFERMRIDFVANASHELRTPLASLLGFIETLQGPARDDGEARARFLTIMREQAQRMARLVDDLLSLSRIEQHLHLRPQEKVDIALTLRHIADTLTPLALDNGVELCLATERPVVVKGDRDELMRVAENLIENAIKYGASEASDRRVILEAQVAGREGILSVRDFGAGIAPEHLPRLTERFYRVDTGESKAKGGTGLGLALVKHIVARHRGRLAIESVKRKGSVFKVILPLAQ